MTSISKRFVLLFDFCGMFDFKLLRLNIFFSILLLQLTASSAQVNMHEIPVLCYHQIHNWLTSDSKSARMYILAPEKFRLQMQLLADSGYHAITPDELLNYYDKNTELPSKPVLITFDDGTASEFVNAVPILKQYHFTAVFFIMTVALNKNFYMSSQQVKTLSDEGFAIGCHTWDHHDVRDYTNDDWAIQFQKPKQLLEKITGKPVDYFAYPYGAWNNAAIEQLKVYKYKAAFQLTEKQSASNSIYTIRRLLVDGNWNAQQLLYAMHHAFK